MRNQQVINKIKQREAHGKGFSLRLKKNSSILITIKNSKYMDSDIVKQIYDLRNKFILIGLTGRTGSGCSTVANVLNKKEISLYNSEFKKINDSTISNNVRKNKIIYNYIQENWQPFVKITASNIIFYFALKDLEYSEFKELYFSEGVPSDNEFEEEYNKLKKQCEECEEYLNGKNFEDFVKNQEYNKLITEKITAFRKRLNLNGNELKFELLQKWGDNIRNYNSVKEQSNILPESPSFLAFKINQFIKLIRHENKIINQSTHIVIDALRSPYEILFFRERYSSFYCFSVNTTKEIRTKQLINQGYSKEKINELDKGENVGSDKINSYKKLSADSCIELSDIHLAHNGKSIEDNRELINQIFTYISLIKHPGLISPSPIERIMQIAFTAKLNSGCLSRQVGAVVTNENFSLKSIGWNTSAQGQTPCTLRCINDLKEKEDINAYSEFERTHENFKNYIVNLYKKYDEKKSSLKGIPTSFCFKDIYTTVEDQEKNQVHTRSLHAEENAFLQLVKYGSQGIFGGKLFTTASPCELCAKKAYQLGIKEIYYIDAYPGISMEHILDAGDNRPKVILFHGAIGRAYVQLFNPLMSLKDEITAITCVDVKNKVSNSEKSSNENGPL